MFTSTYQGLWGLNSSALQSGALAEVSNTDKHKEANLKLSADLATENSGV